MLNYLRLLIDGVIFNDIEEVVDRDIEENEVGTIRDQDKMIDYCILFKLLRLLF